MESALLSPPPTELATLVAAAARGEHDALERLYRQCCDRVYGIALRLLRQAQDAEEVVVDVFQQVWQEAARYDPARGTVEAWLGRIAHSRALDRLRRRRARPDQDAGLDPDALHPDHPDAAYTECEDAAPALLALYEEGHLVRRALAELSPEQQRCVGLAFLEELSHAEIAARTGWPLGTVKSHVRRGMLTLRTRLEAWGYDA
jgi:RNA polymerase sigma-70 factor, ECF subfamily